MTTRGARRPTKRPYRSTLREAQAQATRLAVLDAAGELFEENGYVATTMQSIAERAGVAVETVYAQGSKASLLTACLDRSLVGDDEPVAFLDRPEVASALDSGAQLTMVTGWAEAIALLAGRACRILAAFEQGAASDPVLADLWRDYERRRRQDYERLVGRVADAGPLAAGRDARTAVDLLWALVSPDTTINLLVHCGWSVPRLAAFFSELALELLIPPPRTPRPKRPERRSPP